MTSTSFYIDEGGALRCDLDTLVDTRLLVQANSGGGKSFAVRRLLERTHGSVQHLVLDPEGEFASLREKFDYVHAAARGGDTVASPRSAALLAEKLLELGVSAVLDIYELKAHERIRFVRLFIEALVEAPKKLWHPVLVVVDEAHVFCPQKGDAESAGAVIDLATRGRKRGFCAVLATQRLAKLHKDAAAELNNKLIGRTALDIDLARAAEELGFGKDRWRELRELEAGHFFATGPAFSARGVTPVHVGPVRTTHPKAGSRLTFIAPPPTAKVRALLPKLADLPAEAEQRVKTVEDLHAEVKRLQRELAKAGGPTPAVAPVVERVEVSALTDGDVAALRSMAVEMQIVKTDLGGLFERAISTVAKAQERRAAPLYTIGASARTVSLAQPRPAVARPRSPAALSDAPPLKLGARRMLAALATFHPKPLSRAQVGTLADLSPTTGTFSDYLSALRRAELIVDHANGDLSPTASGIEVAGEVAPPATTEQLVAMWSAKLKKGARAMLDILVAAYPEPVSREDLGAGAGLSPTTGTFSDYLSALRRNGLCEDVGGRGGGLRASDSLFLGGR